MDDSSSSSDSAQGAGPAANVDDRMRLLGGAGAEGLVRGCPTSQHPSTRAGTAGSCCPAWLRAVLSPRMFCCCYRRGSASKENLQQWVSQSAVVLQCCPLTPSKAIEAWLCSCTPRVPPQGHASLLQAISAIEPLLTPLGRAQGGGGSTMSSCSLQGALGILSWSGAVAHHLWALSEQAPAAAIVHETRLVAMLLGGQ